MWPFLVVGIVVILNIDWIVIPTLMCRCFSVFGIRFFDLSRLIPALSLMQILLVVMAISIPGNIIWYWFWGWWVGFILKSATNQKTVQEGIELGKEIKSVIEPMLKKRGYVDRIKDYVTGFIDWATADDNKFLKRLKRGGYVSVFLLAASPESGGRVVATIFSRTFDSKKGLISLLLGDTVKNAYMLFGFWSLVSMVSGSYVKIAVVLVLTYAACRFAYGKLIKRPT